MLHSSRFKASAFPFGISGLDRFSFLPAHLLACVRLKLPVTRSPPTLGYGLVVSLCPTGFPPALCNDLAQPHEPSPLLSRVVSKFTISSKFFSAKRTVPIAFDCFFRQKEPSPLLIDFGNV